MAAPLLVHLMFHPASTDARARAGALHRAFNADPALPGLRVPTVLLAEDGTNLPPATHDLDEAERSIAVLLADDRMAIEQTVPSGRQSWGEFAADIADRCSDGRHRFLPVQLSEAAWPLHERFSETNFIRAYDLEDSLRAPWVERRIVIEMCRFLRGHQSGAKVPVRVFLSHAKRDADEDPKLFKALVDHLNATQPVEAWIDSGQIDPGNNFARDIEAGVCDSAVLVLATAHYSGRPWCRREVLIAKQHARPVVVVDGLQGLDTRSFPYVGNAPVVAWGSGGAPRAVDLLLKELLRHLHVDSLLGRQSRPEDHVLPVPPELATIVPLPQGSPVLYPDPPLGDEELELLAPLGHRLETPLQRVGADRTLSKKKIALSISETDAPERLGLLADHLDAALLEISRHLLLKGATLAYGGHLGKEGYTVALFDLVRAHQQMSGLPPFERIINYVGWPTLLTDESKAKFRWQATFVPTERPDGVEQLEPDTFVDKPKTRFAATTGPRRYAWARGMSRMRERQTAETDARIVLGGKTGPTLSSMAEGGKQLMWYSSRIPGVVEEALLSLQKPQPTYLCGAFGGAAALVIDLLEGRVPPDFSWSFHKQAPGAEAMRELYPQQGIAWLDYPDMARIFREIGVAGLSRSNHLSEDENRELFRSRDLPRIIELILLGLTRALG